MIQLHVHSNYSPLGGLLQLHELVERTKREGAAAGGAPALALTDTNGLYGIVNFVSHCRDVGIKPLIGSEIVGEDFRFVLLSSLHAV